MAWVTREEASYNFNLKSLNVVGEVIISQLRIFWSDNFTKFAVQGEDGSEETSIVKARAPSDDLHHVRLEV